MCLMYIYIYIKKKSTEPNFESQVPMFSQCFDLKETLQFYKFTELLAHDNDTFFFLKCVFWT